jgi:hypothetical protein
MSGSTWPESQTVGVVLIASSHLPSERDFLTYLNGNLGFFYEMDYGERPLKVFLFVAIG